MSPSLTMLLLSTAAAFFLLAASAFASRCDLNEGVWIWEPTSRSPYSGSSCKSMRSAFNCQRNGRTNLKYLNWRWRSRKCNIKRFDAASLLSVMRNKVFLTVGDSYSTNLYESMRCLIESKAQTQSFSGSLFKTGRKASGFMVAQYNATFLKQPSNFLVRSEPEGSASSNGGWKVWLDQVPSDWSGLLRYSHYTLFGAGHWFTNSASNLRKYYVGNNQQSSMTALGAIKMSHTTVRNYLASKGYGGMPMVLTYTARHYSNVYMDGRSDCSRAEGPLGKVEREWATAKSDAMQARKAQMQVFWRSRNVKMVDITRATIARPDAHMQSFGAEQLDCSHWCLPGVPDTWNDIVYSHMVGAI